MVGLLPAMPESKAERGLDGSWAADSDGQQLAEYPLENQPIFEGLIAAAGRLYLATADGGLPCLRGATEEP